MQTKGGPLPDAVAWFPRLRSWITLLLVGITSVACQRARPAGQVARPGTAAPTLLVDAVAPDRMLADRCTLAWKSVLGDSTVTLATVDLSRVPGTSVAFYRGTVMPHLGPAKPGYVVSLMAPAGAVRLETRTALDTTTDSTLTDIVVAALAESTVVAAFADTINQALTVCKTEPRR